MFNLYSIKPKQVLNAFLSNFRKRFFTIVLILCCPIVTFAEELNIQNLLSNMSEAVRTLNYQGRFMYVLGGNTSSFQVQHAVINGKEHERLVFLNQKQQEVVRIGHDVFCIHPGNHLLRKHQDISANPFSDKLSKLEKGINEYYEVLVTDNEMVAGRDAYRISFNSKDSNRYDHALWVDAQSYLLLKADISDANLGTLESFEYVQVEIGKEIPKNVFVHKDYVQHTPKHFDPNIMIKEIHNTDKVKETENWQASWLPEGFYFSGASQQVIKDSKDNERDAAVDMRMYTDGIVAITVFIESMDKVSRFSESSQKGAVSAYSHGAKINKQDFMITVVGEVPLQTAERVAKGMSKNSSFN